MSNERDLAVPGPLLDPVAASLVSELADVVAQAKQTEGVQDVDDALQAWRAHVGRFMRHKRTGDVLFVVAVMDDMSVRAVNLQRAELMEDVLPPELQTEFVPGQWVNVAAKAVHKVRDVVETGVRPALVLNSVRNNQRAHYNTMQARQLTKGNVKVSLCQTAVSKWHLLNAQGPNRDFERFLDAVTMMRPEGVVANALPQSKWADMHATWAPKFGYATGVALPEVLPGLRNMGVVLSKPRFGDNSVWLQCVRLASVSTVDRAIELCDGRAWRDTDLEIYMLPVTHARLRASALIEGGQWNALGYLPPFPEQPVLQPQDLAHLVPDTFCEQHFLERLDDPKFRGFVVHVGAQTAFPLMAPRADGFCDEAVPDASGKVNMLPYFSTESAREFFEKHAYLSLTPVEAGAWSVCRQVAEQEPVRRPSKRRRVSSSRENKAVE